MGLIIEVGYLASVVVSLVHCIYILFLHCIFPAMTKYIFVESLIGTYFLIEDYRYPWCQP
jgi:hypothetical protein